MTHPAKSPPSATSECNRCGVEFSYHPTYGVGRICSDCSDEVDNPKNCCYQMVTNLDTVAQMLEITTKVSHDEPDTVYIPPKETVQVTGESKYAGIIGTLSITDENGNIVLEDVWLSTKSHVLSPNEETKLNINDKNVVGCDGSREWTIKWGDNEIMKRPRKTEETLEKDKEKFADYIFVNGSPFDYNRLNITVKFPEIEDSVPKSKLTRTVEIPNHVIDL